MTSFSRYESRLIHLAWISLLSLLLCGAWLAVAAWPVVTRHIPVGPSIETPLLQFPATPERPAFDWSRFRNRGGAVPEGGGSLAARFRLAGTFFAYGAEGVEKRKAVLDDLEADTQRVVSEGEVLDGVTVVSIYGDRVVLRAGGAEEELWLGFARGKSAGGMPNGSGRGEGNWLGGRRVAENSWVYDRQDLLDYYEELMDNPERLVTVFDSLEPLYDAAGKITGYHLNVKGEADFFETVGMQPGDVVRKVNSMPMISRRRAEYFIREFVADRASAFVLEIERNGQPMKLVYQVR